VKLIAASLLAVVTIAANAADDQSQVTAYRALIDQDLRLATTGYRLASANTEYCERTERNPGWVIHDVAQYPDVAIAKAAFVFENPIQIAAVIKAGPAERADMKAGDGFVGLDSAVLYWPAMPVGKTGYERMASFKQLLGERLAEKPKLPVQLSRAGRDVTATLAPPPVCASDFQVDTKDGLDAGADGQIVRVTYGMMRYASDEAELAAVVAHELSHNILRHHEKLNALGVDRGLGSLFGKSKNAILATEIEADRLSVWLMANAGYDPKAALRFWERYGRQTGQGIFSEGTHLRWKNRIKTMQVEIDLMVTTAKRDGKLPPPLLVSK
jgi:beta-barrel assembly-enhancing protease